MIAGDIQPPGCFLSASEILRRQYLAHLLDLVGAGRLLTPDGDALSPMSRLASDLFGPSAWLPEFQQAALAGGPRLVDVFLTLFPPYDAERARASAPGSRGTARVRHRRSRRRPGRARARWEDRRGEMQHRVESIDRALKALVAGDPDHERQGKELRAERRAVSRHASEISRSTAHGALVDLGLLPNYSLVDSATELEATLVWREDGKDGQAEHHSKVLRYERSARLALTDFAPATTTTYRVTSTASPGSTSAVPIGRRGCGGASAPTAATSARGRRRWIRPPARDASHRRSAMSAACTRCWCPTV
ncbi:hypothetical protein NKH18_38490 [Streptomyces sp. M10(2022)]